MWLTRIAAFLPDLSVVFGWLRKAVLRLLVVCRLAGNASVSPLQIHARARLLDSLRNQTVTVPALKPLFGRWPFLVNPELDRLRADVDEWLRRYAPTRLRGRLSPPGRRWVPR
jgi:hypothetical protein